MRALSNDCEEPGLGLRPFPVVHYGIVYMDVSPITCEQTPSVFGWDESDVTMGTANNYF